MILGFLLMPLYQQVDATAVPHFLGAVKQLLFGSCFWQLQVAGLILQLLYTPDLAFLGNLLPFVSYGSFRWYIAWLLLILLTLFAFSFWLSMLFLAGYSLLADLSMHPYHS